MLLRYFSLSTLTIWPFFTVHKLTKIYTHRQQQQSVYKIQTQINSDLVAWLTGINRFLRKSLRGSGWRLSTTRGGWGSIRTLRLWLWAATWFAGLSCANQRERRTDMFPCQSFWEMGKRRKGGVVAERHTESH